MIDAAGDGGGGEGGSRHTSANEVMVDHTGSSMVMPYSPVPYPSAPGATWPSSNHSQKAMPLMEPPEEALCRQVDDTHHNADMCLLHGQASS